MEIILILMATLLLLDLIGIFGAVILFISMMIFMACTDKINNSPGKRLLRYHIATWISLISTVVVILVGLLKDIF